MIFAQAFIVFVGGLAASRKLHDNMLRNIISSPMSFFDTNPVGRVVTRFSKDIDVVDWFAHTLKWFVESSVTLLTIPVVVAYNIPLFLVTIPPVLIIYITLQVRLSDTHIL